MMLALPRGNTKKHADQWHMYSPMVLIRNKGVQLIENASPLKRKFWLTVENDVFYGKLSKFIQ